MKKYLILTGVVILILAIGIGIKFMFFNPPLYEVESKALKKVDKEVIYDKSLNKEEILIGYYFTEKKPFYLDDRIYVDSIGFKASNFKVNNENFEVYDKSGNLSKTTAFQLDFELLNYGDELFTLEGKKVSLLVESPEKIVQYYGSELTSISDYLDGSFIFSPLKANTMRNGKIFFKVSEESIENADSIKLQVIIDGSPVEVKIK